MEEQGIIKELLVAEIELSYRPTVKVSELPQILRAVDAYNILIQTWDKSKIQFVEQFRILLLNRSNRVLGVCTLTTGTVTGTIVDPKLIFGVALKCNATSIIIAHNHPSGNTTPSQADIGLTERIKQCARLLDVELKDHVIVTSEGYYSFAEEGAL
jgi:DNA repair protein RadC